jgi:hypothetical protein
MLLLTKIGWQTLAAGRGTGKPNASGVCASFSSCQVSRHLWTGAAFPACVCTVPCPQHQALGSVVTNVLLTVPAGWWELNHLIFELEKISSVPTIPSPRLYSGRNPNIDLLLTVPAGW